jgi:hypothetical protein
MIEVRALRFVKQGFNGTAQKSADRVVEDTPDGGLERGDRYIAPSDVTSLLSSQTKVSQVPAGMPADLAQFSLAVSAVHRHLQPTPAMQELERRIRAKEVAAARRQNPASGGLAPASTDGELATQGELWKQLQQRYHWVDQQGRFESLYRPCKVHTWAQCAQDCQD